MVINAAIDKKVEDVGAETSTLFQEVDHEEIEKMRPRDFVKVLHSLNS